MLEQPRIVATGVETLRSVWTQLVHASSKASETAQSIKAVMIELTVQMDRALLRFFVRHGCRSCQNCGGARRRAPVQRNSVLAQLTGSDLRFYALTISVHAVIQYGAYGAFNYPSGWLRQLH